MPHINIKHFPGIDENQQVELVTSIAEVITMALDCDEKFISIALEPITQEQWNSQVYLPEIVGRKELLVKQPGY